MNYTKKDNFIFLLQCVKSLKFKEKEQLLSALGRGNFHEEAERILKDNKNGLLELKDCIENKKYKEIVNYCNENDIIAITRFNEKFPLCILNSMQNPPFVLYAKGNVDLLKSSYKIAVVGSRKPTESAKGYTKDISSNLAGRGVTLITGFAGGIDEVAILEGAKKNNVISVLAGGFSQAEKSYNGKQVKLAEEKGLCITENLFGEVFKFSYAIRNSLIASLSDGVLVTSATEKSGSLITANYAKEYGKKVFALPYSIDDVTGKGCNILIKNGASLVTLADDILSSLGINEKEKEEKKVLLDREEEIIYGAIKRGITSADELVEETKIGVGDLLVILSKLELYGIISSNGNDYYIK